MKKGFTLIEMLVAVTVFTLILGSTAGLFVAGIRSQTTALVSQKLVDETGYVMEKMSRALRMAKKDTTGACLNFCGAGCNYENSQNRDFFIKFINSQDECSGFFSYDPFLRQNSPGGGGGDLPLTSTGFEVTSVVFDLSGESQNETPNLQPRVTILLKIKNANAAKPEMIIQTTISQRNLDVQ